MLRFDENWEKDIVNQGKQKMVEYREKDFYGPFLIMVLKKYKSGKKVVLPLSCIIETPEVSRSHFWLLSKASQEIFNEIGTFTLRTKLFDVIIDSEKTEELIIKQLLGLKFF